MNAEELYKRAVRLGPGRAPKPGQPYVISEDAKRGMRVIGVFEGARQHVYTVQMLPDTYFDEIKDQRERNASLSSTRRIAAGVQPLINIPHNLAQTVFSKDWDGEEQIDPRDYEERDKRLKTLANDSDYRKLRTSEGSV